MRTVMMSFKQARTPWGGSAAALVANVGAL